MEKLKPIHVVGFIVIACVLLPMLGFVLGIFGEGAQIAKEEFGPRAALEKYTWFKQTSQDLLGQAASIEMQAKKVAKSCPEDIKLFNNLSRTERDRCSTWESELSGLKFAYNQLAAEYNAASNRFNWELFDATEGDTIAREFKKF